MLQDFLSFFSLQDATIRFVLFGSVLIGATGGLLGTFAVLRKRSLMGDALAHAALPGVAIAFLVTGSKSLLPLLIGATISGVIGMLMIQAIVNYSRIKADAALGIVLSVFFGLGIVLLTYIQQTAIGNQSGLDKFLFGQAAAMVQSDLKVMAILTLIIIVAVALFYKEFKTLIFDPEFASSIGFSAKTIDLVLMGLIVLTVMVGLQAVGVVLIAAMLITPAVAARFLTDRLNVMLIIAVIFGGFSGAAGTYVSSLAPRIPTGPVMVIVVTALFALSAVFAPRRGLIARWRRHLDNQKRESRQHFLRACYEILEQNGASHNVLLERISEKLNQPHEKTEKIASQLESRGFLSRDNGTVALNSAGMQEAVFIIKSHRLWEQYLLHKDMLTIDHHDRPADEVEHVLTPELIQQLEDHLSSIGINTAEITNIDETESGYRC
ncbi:MAG: iron chelate uptake ABC transporter family permease subunit [Candidatus Marinimicrobia bacterium]|nr:iron chelate uptake ABC transporter family permease subunit [Candidatus Neomarinimicrobiota bacterium]